MIRGAGESVPAACATPPIPSRINAPMLRTERIFWIVVIAWCLLIGNAFIAEVLDRPPATVAPPPTAPPPRYRPLPSLELLPTPPAPRRRAQAPTPAVTPSGVPPPRAACTGASPARTP